MGIDMRIILAKTIIVMPTGLMMKLILSSVNEELSLEINLNENNYFKRIKAWNISVGAGLALGSSS